ncbi:hypothetical protein BVRB_018200, partial [Beta vulgaris subsp. vulgaris]
HTQ